MNGSTVYKRANSRNSLLMNKQPSLINRILCSFDHHLMSFVFLGLFYQHCTVHCTCNREVQPGVQAGRSRPRCGESGTGEQAALGQEPCTCEPGTEGRGLSLQTCTFISFSLLQCKISLMKVTAGNK
jgi:hypothetical protein